MRKMVGAAVAAVMVFGAACSGDDGASVRNVGESGSASGSGSGTGSGTGAATSAPAGALGAYTPVSDVASHANVTTDVCDIAKALPDGAALDFAAATKVYAEGAHSAKSDGTKRTLKGFASTPLDEPSWKQYAAHFGSERWLDGYVSEALAGSGAFRGVAEGARRQAVLKGTQNQVLVAWVLHELDAATSKVAEGKTAAADGAPHNIDEGWAFYRGTSPDCSPFATADKRGADFGTAATVNTKIAAAFTAAQKAAGAGDKAALAAAVKDVTKLLAIPYVQATIKYAAKASDKVAQAEGWSFFRVIEPIVAAADAQAAKTIAAQLDVRNTAAADAGAKVKAAIESVYDELGITSADVGVLKS